MSRALTLAVAVFSTTVASNAPAQQAAGVLGLRVKDATSSQTISGARAVIVSSPEVSCVTKTDGMCLLRAKPGTYKVRVSATGYYPAEFANVGIGEQRVGSGMTVGLTPYDGAKEMALTGSAKIPLVEQGVVTEQGAVAQSRIPYPVRTFQLQSLSPNAAASLLTPYMPDGPRGTTGVFDAGSSINAITVRAPREILVLVDSLLRLYDHAPPTITLHFKLIVATDSAVRADNSIVEIDATLRQMFRFNGYHEIAEGTTTISPNGGANGATWSAFTMNFKGGGTDYWLSGNIGAASGSGANLTQQLTVSLYGNSSSSNPAGTGQASNGGGRGLGPGQRSILSTGLSVPMGQTVIIGGATGNDAGRTLILTVRPELVVPIKR
jgi:hypothetical protein